MFKALTCYLMAVILGLTGLMVTAHLLGPVGWLVGLTLTVLTIVLVVMLRSPRVGS